MILEATTLEEHTSSLTQFSTVTGTLDELNGWWVFNVYNAEDHELLYTGCERLRTIPTLRELKRHITSAPLDKVQVELVCSYPTEQAGLEVADMLKTINPPRYAATRQTPSYPVRCNETGKVYKNAFQAAKANNINSSYMYLHLQGAESYKTCKGLTFKYDK